MPWSTSIPVIVWTLLLVVLGVLFWLRRPRTNVTALILWLDLLAINLVFFYSINWSIVNYYLRYLCLIVPAALLVRILLHLRGNPWLPAKSARGAQAAFFIALILLPFFSLADWRVFSSLRYDKEGPVPLLILVPVYGMWVVTNGGNAAGGLGMSNYANPIFPPDTYTDPSMAYGVDLQEITFLGNLGQGDSRPNDFAAYEGFNNEVFAPCPGKVVFVEDGLPQVQIDKPADKMGNRVVIQCFETYVTVANMRGVLVKVGDDVAVGGTIGYVGNTRWPSMPHLHIHASVNSYGSDGTPVPLLFEYVFAGRNRIFIR